MWQKLSINGLNGRTFFFVKPFGQDIFIQINSFASRKRPFALFGRRVDLVTWKAVKDPFFRENAEATAIDLYAA